MKATSSKNLAIQEPTTNNLVVLTEALEFNKSDQGKQPCMFRKKSTNIFLKTDSQKHNSIGEIQDSQEKTDSSSGSVELLP